MKLLLVFVLLCPFHLGFTQSFVVKDIRSFGAKGNGITNDQKAFEKAATFFNQRGGNGKLVISRGTYVVGRQDFTGSQTGKPAYYGHDVLHFSNVRNLTIEGKNGVLLRYADSLRFGAFDPQTGRVFPNQKYFVKYAYAAFIGNCILIENSEGVQVKNLELDGNNKAALLGGVYGDKGRQLPHYGISLVNSRNVNINNVYAHHFCLDGMSIANKASDREDENKLKDCRFEYNSRQGLSWIGGNDLKAKKCHFNHTGQGSFASPPGAGLDIEAEVGPVRNGEFEDCEFINNRGVGMVADNGNSANCSFKSCTFWGASAYALWVNRPGFTFTDCNIYGSFVHGYNASTNEEATKFVNCQFEDKSYKGKEPYGNFLVESNGRKRISFTNCTFVSHKKKLLWVQLDPKSSPEEKYQFESCQFVINNDNLPNKDFVAVIRGIRYKNCTFNYTSTAAKEKHYYLNSCCGNLNVDEGGNKIIYDR